MQSGIQQLVDMVLLVWYCRGHGNPVARLAAPGRCPCSLDSVRLVYGAHVQCAGHIGSTCALHATFCTH